jgi:hypothetical protein
MNFRQRWFWHLFSLVMSCTPFLRLCNAFLVLRVTIDTPLVVVVCGYMVFFFTSDAKEKVDEPLKDSPDSAFESSLDVNAIAQQLIAFPASHTVQPFAKSIFSHGLLQ